MDRIVSLKNAEQDIHLCSIYIYIYIHASTIGMQIIWCNHSSSPNWTTGTTVSQDKVGSVSLQYTPIRSPNCWVYGDSKWALSPTSWGEKPTNIPCSMVQHLACCSCRRCGNLLSIWQTRTHRGCAEGKAAALPCRSLRRVDRNPPSWTWQKRSWFQRESPSWLNSESEKNNNKSLKHP